MGKTRQSDCAPQNLSQCCFSDAYLFRIILNMEIERLQMNVIHQHSSSQFSAPIEGIEPDREHNQRLFYSMGRHIYSLNKSNGYSQSVMVTKENIMSFHQIADLKFLIKDASTIRVNSTEKHTTIESNLLACKLLYWQRLIVCSIHRKNWVQLL